MFLKQNKLTKLIAIILIFIVGVSSGTTISPVACIESDGEVNIESGCSTISEHDSTTNDPDNIDHCNDCFDIPLSHYLPEINQIIKSDTKNNLLNSFDIISFPRFIQKQNLAHIDYGRQLFTNNDQSNLAMSSTRFLL